MNKVELIQKLDEINFGDFFYNNYFIHEYSIDYGNRIGNLTFPSLLEAGLHYSYINNDFPINNYDQFTAKWKDILRNENDLCKKLLCIVEIFVWGGVPKKNIKKAIDFYNLNQLENRLQDLSNYFNNEDSENLPNINNYFSSGWTKISHFLIQNVMIYDSRSAAFLNFILNRIADINPNIVLTPIFSELVQINSLSPNRLRYINNDHFANYSPANHLKANLIGSWIIEYLVYNNNFGVEEFHTQFDLFDKAFFMLGFDLNQIV
ncbi:MAG: hypothetical protein WAR79_14190 [Melioribacteraceae bacterium]